MTGPLTILALILSGIGLAYLAVTDPKRRRAFAQPVLERRRWKLVARLLVFLPGFGLAFLGDVAAVIIWLGAITVLGWGIAALSPLHIDALKSKSREAAGNYAMRLAGLATPLRAAAGVVLGSLSWALSKGVERVTPGQVPVLVLPSRRGDSARIAELEARVVALEAALADLAPATEIAVEMPAPPLALAGNAS
ncbi:MAG: hypothetical protein AAGF44_01055 [Pseudomonadota bacterium]